MYVCMFAYVFCLEFTGNGYREALKKPRRLRDTAEELREARLVRQRKYVRRTKTAAT